MPRIDTEPDQPREPEPPFAFAEATNFVNAALRHGAPRVHAYDCDFIRGTRRDTCSCGTAA